jgi:hypothetical protein
MHIEMRYVISLCFLVGLAPVRAHGNSAVPMKPVQQPVVPSALPVPDAGVIHLAADDTTRATATESVEVPDDAPLYAGVQVQQAGNTEGTYYISGGSTETIDQVATGLDREATRHGWTQTESTKAEAIGGEGRVLKYRKGERTMEIYLAPGLDAPGTSVSINLAEEAGKG